MILDLTQADLAQCVGCSVSTIRKIELDERRPSRQIAELLAQCLHIPSDEQATFLNVARSNLRVERLARLSPTQAAGPTATTLPPAGRPGLPLSPNPLLGREVEVPEITRLLQDAACRLLTLVGPGGVGKTRLALEVARLHLTASAPPTPDNHLQNFADGVYFVSLASVGVVDFITPTLAEGLGLTFYGPIEPQTQLLTYLQDKNLLLVVDNMEHLLAGIEILAAIIQQAPQVKLLVTSRERLNLQSEWAFNVQGLPVPPTDQAEAFELYSAVALFQQSARRVFAGFELTAPDRPAVARICQLMGGMPLGIELAAAWVRALSCSDIVREIERNFDFLTATARDMPARHRSLRAAFDHSWQLLSAEEQQVLQRLSIFRGGFQRQAAQQVAGTTLPLLVALVDKSLLQRAGEGRFDLHELIRQYASSHLQADPSEQTATYNRHSGYYLSLLEAQSTTLQSSRQKEALAELTLEIDNLRLAWGWAVAQGQISMLRGTIWPLWYYYELRGLFQEGEAMLQRAWELRAQLLPAEPAEAAVQATTLNLLLAYGAFFSFRLGRLDEAMSQLRQSIELLRQHNDQSMLAEALWIYAAACWFAGEFEEAASHARESYALEKVLNRRWQTIVTAEFVGIMAHELGQYDEAYRWLEEAFEICQAVGDPRGIGHVTCFFSRTAFVLGQFDPMEPFLRQGLQLATETGDCFVMGLALEQLGQIAQIKQEISEARCLYQESIALHRQLGDLRGLSGALTLLGRLELAAGQTEEAQRYFAEALTLAVQVQVYPQALNALTGMAEVQAGADAAASALELALYILQHSAATSEAKGHAERLRLELAADLVPTQIEAIQARLQALTLEEVARNILKT